MREFVDWHYDRHASDRAIIDSYFDPEKFDEELANLSGDFVPPRGALLVAEEENGIAGCVALRRLSDDTCERSCSQAKKRMKARRCCVT